MQIKSNKKIIIIVVAIICVCLLWYSIIISRAKQRYSLQIASQLQNLLQQQQLLLQRLGKNLINPIQRQDLDSIRVNLHSYEDLIFSLSKQNLAVPVSLHYVSLTAPQQIISSNGKIDHHVLAPDEAYYFTIAENPYGLAFSKPYVKPEMPEYFLCNWGLGIVDQNNIYHGQLDVNVSLEAIHNYIAKNLNSNSKIFSFRISNTNIINPEITVQYLEYSLAILRYTVLTMLIIGFIIIVKVYIFKLYRVFVGKGEDLIMATKQLDLLAAQNAAAKLALRTQYQYGVLANDVITNAEELLDLKQLLIDIHAVNAELALERKINLVFPAANKDVLQFYGNRLRLMQILAGILYETILQLAANSTINLQLIVTDMQKGIQQLQFKFSDNGFYNKLEDRNVAVSCADVRVQGWNNIYHLVDLEDGALEHEHTAYSGNVISFTIVRKIEQKIVHLESYYQ